MAYAEFLHCRCCKRPVDGLNTHQLASVGIQVGLERLSHRLVSAAVVPTGHLVEG